MNLKERFKINPNSFEETILLVSASLDDRAPRSTTDGCSLSVVEV
ncbi:MAG TPA: hypothetical protein VK155_07500 [Bacteroidales bacterium]|nr:hypothetical protein [Bacteroidales bacterium]